MSDFDGETIDGPRDDARLGRQLTLVRDAMSDGAWHTLRELSMRVPASQPSVSARIRDLRKARFGAHKIERRHVSRGLWEYRMVKP